MSATTVRRIAAGASVLAILGMGSLTAACSPRTEKPAETPQPGQSSATPSPTEKNVRTNVTRSPISAVPPGGGNPAVPCGFGPAGGGPCTNR